jgi:hypothetical protein
MAMRADVDPVHDSAASDATTAKVRVDVAVRPFFKKRSLPGGGGEVGKTERVEIKTRRAISCRALRCEPLPRLQRAFLRESRGLSRCGHGVPPFRGVRRRDAWPLLRGGWRHA